MMNDLRSIVINQSLLIGMGVGVAGASSSVTITQDIGVSLVGSMFTLAAGTMLDNNASVGAMKRWRVYDTLIAVAQTSLSLAVGMYPGSRLPLRLLSTAISNVLLPLGAGAKDSVILHLSNNR